MYYWLYWRCKRQHCRHMAAVRSTPSLANSFFHQLCVNLVVPLLAQMHVTAAAVLHGSNIAVLLLFVNDV